MSIVEFFVYLGIAFYVATCLAIFDVARKNFGGMEKKLLWGFIALIPFLGPIVYFTVGFRKGKKQK